MFERPFRGVRLLALIVLFVAVVGVLAYAVSIWFEVASSGWGDTLGRFLGMVGMVGTSAGMALLLKDQARSRTKQINDE